MADTKKILVVDDHFEMLDFLRSMLELSSQEYEVMAVPSAEEGMLEMRQTKYDLLITDVRLPGMSGFDLIRRMKRFQADLPAIMITAYSSGQGRDEAESLGVYRYFEKPLDTDEVLAAVHAALYSELVVHADVPPVESEVDISIPDGVSKRLELLRSDTGAAQLALATVDGRQLLQLGRGRGLNLAKLTSLIAQNLDASFLLAKELGGEHPTTIQYHAGDEIELYVANVGDGYFLAIFFDAQAKRGRMGTIWVFAQRAIKDLLGMLPVRLGEDDDGAQHSQASSGDHDRQDALPGDSSPLPDTELETAPRPILEYEDRAKEISVEVEQGIAAPTEAEGFFTLDIASANNPTDLDQFWDASVEESTVSSSDSDAFSFEEAQRQGLMPKEDGTEVEPVVADREDPLSNEISNLEQILVEDETVIDGANELSDFWDDAALQAESGAGFSDGLSLEEAREQGLIPTSFGQELETGKGPDSVENLTEDDKLASDPMPKTSNKSDVKDDDDDLDLFWETAAAQDGHSGGESVKTNGLSFEEAKRLGLLSGDLPLDEDSD